MADIVERLRAPANWLRQDKGSEWKNAINSYDRTPFEAADEIERLREAIKCAIRQHEEGNKGLAHRTLCEAVYGPQA